MEPTSRPDLSSAHLSTRMPDLRALEILLVVARTHSLNGAARELGITQQAVSARVAALEAVTGVQLVVRSVQGSTLTSAGVLVAAWAEKLLSVAAELDTGLATLRHGQRTHLRVSSSLTIAEHLLPGWLVSFHQSSARLGRPVAEVELTATNSDTVIGQVLGEIADIGFVEGPYLPRGLRRRVLARDHLVVVVRPDHCWASRGRPVSAEEIATTSLVSREEGSGTRYALAHALRRALGPGMSQAPPSMALSTTAAVRAAVLAGAGPAVLSALALVDDLESRRLVAVPVEDLDLHRELRVVWNGNAQPPAGAARDLISHVADLAAKPR